MVKVKPVNNIESELNTVSKDYVSTKKVSRLDLLTKRSNPIQRKLDLDLIY